MTASGKAHEKGGAGNNMIKEAIIKIVDKQDLTYDEAYTVMHEIMSGETSPT